MARKTEASATKLSPSIPSLEGKYVCVVMDNHYVYVGKLLDHTSEAITLNPAANIRFWRDPKRSLFHIINGPNKETTTDLVGAELTLNCSKFNQMWTVNSEPWIEKFRELFEEFR